MADALPLKVERLGRRYGRLVGLDRLDLELRAGECVALIGANGSGKSTAVRTIAGLLEPSEGSVRIAGHDPHVEPDGELARAALALVPDSPLLYDDLTVRQHLELVALAHGVAGDGTEERIGALLDRLGLTARADFLPAELSRGMRQKTGWPARSCGRRGCWCSTSRWSGSTRRRRRCSRAAARGQARGHRGAADHAPDALRRRRGRPGAAARRGQGARPRGRGATSACAPSGAAGCPRVSSALAVAGRKRTPVRGIRAWRRGAHPAPGLLKRLEPVYYVFITLAIGGPFVYGTASAALADVATPRAVAVWGPSVALVALLAVVRWGAVQGPVVFSVPDVAQLLGAPLRRAELTLGRLLRGLAIGAAGAAVIGGLALIGVLSGGRSLAVSRAVGFVAGITLLGLLGVALASLVQGSRRWDRASRRAVWPVLAAAVGLVALAGSGTAGAHVALWCGPWGWAIQPATGIAGAWPLALALLAAVAAASAALALARRGVSSTERHMVRAEARGGAVAALYSMNARYARRSLTSVNAGPAAVPRARLRAPRSERWAIAWRDAVAALAVPQRLGEALALAAGGTLVIVLNARHPVAVGAGALAVYVGAARLLEPLRAETDKPGRTRVLLIAPNGARAGRARARPRRGRARRSARRGRGLRDRGRAARARRRRRAARRRWRRRRSCSVRRSAPVAAAACRRACSR